MNNKLFLYGAPTGSTVTFEIRGLDGSLQTTLTAIESSTEVFEAIITGITTGSYDAICKVNSTYNSITSFYWNGTECVEKSKAVADKVWNSTLSEFTSPGTTGFNQNQISTAINVVQTILKYHKNRNKIDPLTYTLTVYEDDGITPLRVFDLRDFTGNFSLSEIAERRPV